MSEYVFIQTFIVSESGMEQPNCENGGKNSFLFKILIYSIKLPNIKMYFKKELHNFQAVYIYFGKNF